MTKKKKYSSQYESLPSSPNLNLNLELDNKALRAKNGQLVQTVAKLQQEKTLQQNQITSLQEEYFKLNSKFMNLKGIFSTIDSATKQWFPKYVQLSEMCTKIMQLCNVGMTVADLNKDPRTQKVKPQIVNGHVLHNPTITLSRLSDSNRTPSPRRYSNSNSPQRHSGMEALNLSKPSTSRNHQNMEEEDSDSDEDNEDDDNQYNNDEDNEDEDNQYNNEHHLVNIGKRRCYSRRPTVSCNLDPLHLDNSREDEAESEMSENGEDSNENDYCSRLITIHEEDEEEADSYHSPTLTTSKIYSERVREVRIYIDPLPKECLKLSTTASSGKSSISIMSSSPPMKRSLGEASNSRISTSVSLTLSPSKKIVNNRKAVYYRESSTFEEISNTSGMSDMEVKCKIDDRFISSPEFSGHLSTITNVPSCSSRCIDGSCSPFNSLNNSKEEVMRSLGLESNHRLTTSTPLSDKRPTRRRKKFAIYSDENSLTPRLSNVSKRRRLSDEKKVPQVILKRMSLERRLSGSPLKKIGDVLNTSVITKISNMKRSSSDRFSNEKLVNGNSKYKDNIDKSSPDNQKSPREDKKTTFKKSQTRLLPSTQMVLRASPRPKRAARPTAPMKELSLRKKMRRSK